jgi:hypothetical protein
VAFDLVLPEVFPRPKFLAALFTGILQPPLTFFLGPAFRNVVADEPLCNPDQANVVAGRLYMEICVIIIRIR